MKRLPAPISQEKLAELVPKLKRGDKGVEEEIVTGHLRLAVKIAIAKSRMNNDRYRKEVDDFIGEAMYAVAKAVRRVRRGALYRDDNITGFIIDYVKKHIHNLTTKKLMGVPHRTVTYWNSKLDERARHLPVRVSSISGDVDGPNFTPEVSDQGEIDRVDLEEIINMLPKSLLEKKVLELRKKGMTLVEIEREIGYSKSRIQQVLVGMEELFDRIIRGIG